jgi:uncharacterized protein YoxC
VTDPIFWLGLSILLVAISLTALLTVAIPAFRELGRAARSAEKLFDTINRELPPTLEALRLTGLEVTDLTDDVTRGVQSATQVVKQVDQSLTGVKQQVQKAQTTSRSLLVGVKTAWRTFTQPNKSRRSSRSLTNADRRSLPRPYREDLNGNSIEAVEMRSESEQHYEWEDIPEQSSSNPPAPSRQGIPPEQDVE